jgi:hypothetical protein
LGEGLISPYLLHDTSFAFAEGDVTTRLVRDVLDPDLATTRLATLFVDIREATGDVLGLPTTLLGA